MDIDSDDLYEYLGRNWVDAGRCFSCDHYWKGGCIRYINGVRFESLYTTAGNGCWK